MDAKSYVKRLSVSATILALVLVSCVLCTGCGMMGAGESEGRVRFELVSPLFPPTTSQSELVFRLLDTAGQPITDADLYLTASMDHGGSMASMLLRARADQDGLYTIPIEWPMSGEWLLTAEATRADGLSESHAFELEVVATGPECAPEQTETTN